MPNNNDIVSAEVNGRVFYFKRSNGITEALNARNAYLFPRWMTKNPEYFDMGKSLYQIVSYMFGDVNRTDRNSKELCDRVSTILFEKGHFISVNGDWLVILPDVQTQLMFDEFVKLDREAWGELVL